MNLLGIPFTLPSTRISELFVKNDAVSVKTTKHKADSVKNSLNWVLDLE
jgi:hypothetical protein